MTDLMIETLHKAVTRAQESLGTLIRFQQEKFSVMESRGFAEVLFLLLASQRSPSQSCACF